MSDNPFGNRSQIRIVSRSKNNSRSRTAHHIRTHKANVVQLYHATLAVLLSFRYRTLFNRIRLSGKRRLADKQILCLNDTDIRRNHVTGSYHHNISGYQFGNADFFVVTSSTFHITRVGHHLQQRFTRHVCLPLLTKTENGAAHYHHGNDDNSRPVLFSRIGKQHIQHERNDNQNRQNTDKRINKRLDEGRNRIFLLFMFHFILAIKRLSFLYFFHTDSRRSSLKITEYSVQWLSCRQKYLLGIKSELCLTLLVLPHCHTSFTSYYHVSFSRCKSRTDTAKRQLENN